MDRPQQIIAVAKAYAAAEDIPLTTVSRRVFQNGTRLSLLIKGGDIQTRTADAAMQWLSDHWPTNAVWPDAVERPAISTPKARPAVAAAVSPASSLSPSIQEVPHG